MTARPYDADFDRQKLVYHPVEVAHWLSSGKSIGPIYTEMELSNRCNCSCIFCGVDHQVNHTGEVMKLGLAKKIIIGLAELGNKSLMICGHGEPLLNPEVVKIVKFAAARMSVSMTTNGAAMTEAKLELIDKLEWLRFSVNGCSPENYQLVHGCGVEIFDRVLANISTAVERKKRLGLPVTIGVQLVLLPENEKLVIDLARLVKKIGVDYFSVKPYSQHPLSNNRHAVDYSKLLWLEDELRPLEDYSFNLIFRAAAMHKAGRTKEYEKCFGCHFMTFVSANGDLWACNVFAGNRKFFIGNVAEEELREIWNGPRRQQVMTFIEKKLTLSQCRDLCRMDACNSYLWRLKHPWPHDNFI